MIAETVHDLLYFGDESPEKVKQEILSRWPKTEFENDSDYIHGERLAVKIEGVSSDEFFKFAVEKGFASISLNIGLAIRLHPQRCKDLLQEMGRG